MSFKIEQADGTTFVKRRWNVCRMMPDRFAPKGTTIVWGTLIECVAGNNAGLRGCVCKVCPMSHQFNTLDGRKIL